MIGRTLHIMSVEDIQNATDHKWLQILAHAFLTMIPDDKEEKRVLVRKCELARATCIVGPLKKLPQARFWAALKELILSTYGLVTTTPTEEDYGSEGDIPEKDRAVGHKDGEQDSRPDRPGNEHPGASG